MDRRTFLMSTPAAALSAGLATSAHADGHSAAQLPAMIRRTVGEVTVTALSDGFLPIGADVLQGITAEAFDRLVEGAYKDPAQNLAAVNAFVIETGEARILLDVGTGTAFGPTLGQLGDNLARAGVAPDSITHLVATHMHPDHIGGVIGEGALALPQAELVVSEADHSFFTSADVRAQAPDAFKPFFDMAMGAAGVFSDRTKLISGEAGIAPGLTAIPLPGHTPGHIGLRIDSNGESLMIWGDIMHVPSVQFRHPEVTIAFDADADQARATRAALLDQLAGEGTLISGMHMGFPGFGYVERASEGYRFVPAPWDYT